jgi:hypothetical protein
MAIKMLSEKIPICANEQDVYVNEYRSRNPKRVEEWEKYLAGLPSKLVCFIFFLLLFAGSYNSFISPYNQSPSSS